MADLSNEQLIQKLEKLESSFARHIGPSPGKSQIGTPHPTVIPSGLISMWSGAIADIPTGWVLCDGDNDTPDLRGKFIVGAGDAYDPADTGGAETMTLTGTHLPAHTHAPGSLATGSAGAHTHGAGTYTYNSNASFDNAAAGAGVSNVRLGATTPGVSGSSASGGSHSHGSLTGATGSAGSGNSFSILPPYYALAFIMKT